MDTLSRLLSAEVAAFVLETARVAGLVAASPLPWSHAPVRARAGVVIALAVLCHGQAGVDPATSGSMLALGLGVVGEVGLGVALGFVVRLVLAVGEVFSEVVAPSMGLAVAQVFDPTRNTSETVLTRVMVLLTTLLALAVGLHHVVLGALVSSFRVVPPGEIASLPLVALPLLDLAAEVVTTGVRLALPMLAILTTVQLAIGMVSRAAPAMQLFSIGFAATLAIGWGSLFVLSPDLVHETSEVYRQTGERLESVLAPLPR